MTFIWQKKKKVISYERVASNLEGGKDKAECSGRETGRGGGAKRCGSSIARAFNEVVFFHLIERTEASTLNRGGRRSYMCQSRSGRRRRRGRQELGAPV